MGGVEEGGEEGGVILGSVEATGNMRAVKMFLQVAAGMSQCWLHEWGKPKLCLERWFGSVCLSGTRVHDLHL